jgi:capsular polysaccharide export protein
MPRPICARWRSAAGRDCCDMEDGFVRSVGLGSDFIRPLSLVLDGRGIYFDPTQPSDLEHMLNMVEFTGEELTRARACA